MNAIAEDTQRPGSALRIKTNAAGTALTKRIKSLAAKARSAGLSYTGNALQIPNIGPVIASLFGSTPVPQQLAAGVSHTCALLQNGTVKCWGSNSMGQLGLGAMNFNLGVIPDQMGRNLPTVDLGAHTALQITAGEFHTCALLENNAVKCWGWNGLGQLGLSVSSIGPSTVNLGSKHKVRQIVAGGVNTCALLDNGKVKCWGDNYFGQLGESDYLTGDPPVYYKHIPKTDLDKGHGTRQLAIGLGHVCALLDDGTVKCTGYGEYGQLGLANTYVKDLTMGEKPSKVDLGKERKARQIFADSFRTCAILDEGSVKCWGSNASGELGLGDTNHRGDQPGEMGADLPSVDLGVGRTALQLTMGGWHTCALLDDFSVKCWGYNDAGELGLGDRNPRGNNPGQMGMNLPQVDLGPGISARQIEAGSEHTCALLENGRLKCWGENISGELGLGDTDNRGDIPSEMGLNLPEVNLVE